MDQETIAKLYADLHKELGDAPADGLSALHYLHALEFAICALSKDPAATDKLLVLLCDAYHDANQL